MNDNITRKAVIYCRAATAQQNAEGEALGGQERCCRAYAEAKAYAVVEVFRDIGSSLATDRPGLQAMLSFLKEHRAAQPVVIIDDMVRLSRSAITYLELYSAMEDMGAKLQVTNAQAEESAPSLLVIKMMAAISQFLSEAEKASEHARRNDAGHDE